MDILSDSRKTDRITITPIDTADEKDETCLYLRSPALVRFAEDARAGFERNLMRSHSKIEKQEGCQTRCGLITL